MKAEPVLAIQGINGILESVSTVAAKKPAELHGDPQFFKVSFTAPSTKLPRSSRLLLSAREHSSTDSY